MRKLMIALQAVAILLLLLVAIGNALRGDYGNAGVALVAAILMGRA